MKDNVNKIKENQEVGKHHPDFKQENIINIIIKSIIQDRL